MQYEVERVYLTDIDGRPQQIPEPIVIIEAASAELAVMRFLEQDGARLLGTILRAAGDQCTASGWREGRLYVITVWRAGSGPPV